jgi:hypothetical protein
MIFRRGLAFFFGTLCTIPIACAAEPNQTFASATLLPPGTLIVSDFLTPGQVQAPDTFLGIRNGAGSITQTDDNGSIFGGTASGLNDVPTNSTSISFSITGVGDTGFTGSHSQMGSFTVFIDVFNSMGVSAGSIQQTRALNPGAIQNFVFSNAAWNNGSYDVHIDNTLSDPVGGDVDFFTFQGLTPGTSFLAQTFEGASGVNTFLNWYNSSGALIGTDDGIGVGDLPEIAGVIPANGQLTFAVTGFGDQLATGAHTEGGAYTVRVSLPTVLTADFDHNGTVDAADLAIWKANVGQNTAGDSDLDFDTDGADFLAWQRQLGSSSAAAALHAVPEPATLAVLALGASAAAAAVRRHSRRS